MSSPSSSSSEGWEDIEPEGQEDLQVVCLQNDAKFSTVELLLAHCKKEHQFDLNGLRSSLHLDFYGTIKLVNYIRSEVKAGRPIPTPSSSVEFEDEKYLRPVLEDDALLFALDGVWGGEESLATPTNDHQARISDLEAALSSLQTQFVEYKLAVAKNLEDRVEEQDSNLLKTVQSIDKSKSKPEDNDSHYFTSYSYNDIHEIMLKDAVRTDSYRNFVYAHKPLFHDRVVLDVGCGTGILSMFCARAGAKKVLAVDNSDIIHKCRQNVFDNGLDDVITCIRGKIEEVTLPVAQVDIIISEWMGYCLLYEAMLDSVLWARDRYLEPVGGIMMPSHMTLRIAPLCEADYVADHIEWWRSVYGFKMTSMLEGIYDEVLIRDVPSSAVATKHASTFLHLPLYNVKVTDLEFTTPFETIVDTSEEKEKVLDGWIIWFDTFFLPGRAEDLAEDAVAGQDWEKDQKGVAFSTGPVEKGGLGTHWRQGCLLIDHAKAAGDQKASGEPQMLRTGDKLRGEVGYQKRVGNEREVDLEISWSVISMDGQISEKRQQKWFMR